MSSAPGDDLSIGLDFHPARYFPFGGWDDDGMSSALPQQPREFNVHYLPFGGWGDDGMSSALDDKLSTGLDFHPPRYFPFGGWGDDGMSSAPS